MLRKMKLIILFSLYVVLSPGLASALGLGQLKVQSALNENLHAEIELITVSDEELKTLKAGLAENILFQTNRLPVTDELKSLTFGIVGVGRKHYIRIDSSQPFTQANTSFFLKVESSSGVLVRKYKIVLSSNLKPAVSATVQMPDQAKEKSGQAKAVRVVVSNGQTLWSIASQYTVASDVSGSQMMLAIQTVNPDAFNVSNINELKKGSVLIIPTLAEARSIKPAQALNQVKQQVQQWKQHRALQASIPNTRLPTVKVDSKQKLSILAKTADAPANTNSTSIELTGLQQQKQLLQEQLGSKEEQNLELRNRLDNLERVLQKQEAIISVQNQQLAQLQLILERFENLAPQSPKASPSANPAETSVIAGSALNIEIKAFFDRFLVLSDQALDASKQAWWKLKAWLQQRSIAFLLGVPTVSLWLLVMLMMLLLRRRKSEAVSAPDEPHVAAAEVPVEMQRSAAPKEPEAIILDDDVLKDLVGDVPDFEIDDAPEELPEDAATKLALVTVLVEMGDYSAAKESLHEVIAEGNAEQVKRAQQILATLVDAE